MGIHHMDNSVASERGNTKQKRDPAWKYCQVYKNDSNKQELKCAFCGKVFKGGGIHRVKKHLAGAKGDGGNPCLRVDPDVRTAMQESLTGVVGKRRKKHKFVDAEELPNQSVGPLHQTPTVSRNNCNIDIESLWNGDDDLNTVGDLHPVHNPLEESSDKVVTSDGPSEGTNGEEREVVFNRRQRTRSEVKDEAHLEPVFIGSFKSDVAWKHCQIFSNRGKTRLTCLYCGKVFNGGGIYRFKEHLAGRSGNGRICSKVHADVRLIMQENLIASGSMGRKKRKRKPFVEILNQDAVNKDVHTQSNGCDLRNDIDLIEVEDTLEQSSDIFVNRVVNASTLEKPQRSPAFAADGNTATGSRSVDNLVQTAIGHFVLYAGISFDAINSVFFQRIVEAIASLGSTVVTPCDDLRSWILRDAVKEVKGDMDKFKGCWARNGCSILVDEWKTQNDRTLIIVFVNCSEGNLFLKSMDISDMRNSADTLFQLLANVIEEVGVDNVLQVVTRCEERYIVCGKKLANFYPTLLWTPCVSHCLSLMLEDFARVDWISATLEQCRSGTRFIYNHNVILNMMKRHTFGVDLVDIGATRPATDFMTLNRMLTIKQNLQNMVTSEEWTGSSYSRNPEGLAMLSCFSSESFWSTCALITHLTVPFLRLLRIVSSEKRPAMGYAYAGLYRAKETMKKAFVEQKDCIAFLDIIDRRSEHLQHHPLLAAGFYLNPKFYYSTDGHHIRSLLYDCVETLVSEPNIQDKIVKGTISYQNGVGDFGRKMAVRGRDTLLPAEWWSTYGGACPNLARFAIRILSQTCSLISSKPSHIPLERLHETKNCLEHQRLSDLILVQYNWWLKERFTKNKEQEPVDPLLHENTSVVEDWIMKEETHSKDPSLLDWKTVSPPTGNIMLLGSQAEDYEALGSGFDDVELIGGMKDNKAEN